MRFLLSVLMLGVCLSGCVGVSLYGNKDAVISKTDFSRVPSFQDREKPPNRTPDKQFPDGTEMYILQHDTSWCGVVIWAIIPIPLMLPLCHDHLEMTYKEGKPIQMTSQWSGLTFVAACVPWWIVTGDPKICRYSNSPH